MRKLQAVGPRLRHGKDAERARQLEQLVHEANDGLRRVLRAGFFIECLVADLPHGQLESWLRVFCPNTPLRTIRRWRQIAGNVGELVGVSFEERTTLKLPLHEALTMRADELPDDLRVIRQKIEDQIEGRTATQLFLQFKNSREVDGVDVPATGAGRYHQRREKSGEEVRAEVMTADAELDVACEEWIELTARVWQDDVIESRAPGLRARMQAARDAILRETQEEA
jgi:hypothetical protein